MKSVVKASLFSSVFCSSIVFAVSSAIAQESLTFPIAQDSSNSPVSIRLTPSRSAHQTITNATAANTTAANATVTDATVSDLTSPGLTTSASDLNPDLAPVELITQQPLTPNNSETPTDSPDTPAAETSTDPPVNNPLLPPTGWRFDFEPYLFIPLDVNGNIFFGRGRRVLFPNLPGVISNDSGIELSVNASLPDITSRLTNIFGASGRFQAWNGDLGIVAEGLYINAGFRNSSTGGTFTLRDQFNIPVPGFTIDTNSTISSFALAGSYRLLTVPLGGVADPSNPNDYYPAISLEALAGARYLSASQSVEFERGPRFEFGGSEINPMLGGTIKLMLSDKFAFYFRGDTSNLGGGDLRQYYNLYAGIDWKFSDSFALRVAYRLNQIEYVRRGRLDGDNGFNLQTQGVQLGVSWQF